MAKWSNQHHPGAVTAIGIAANEIDHRPTNEPGKIYPLAELGITEADGLQLYYDAGVTFGGHYHIWDRLSCLFCPLQGLKNFRSLRNIHPDLWSEIVALVDRITAYDSLREGETARDLDDRFRLEDRISEIEVDRQVLEGQIFRLKAETKTMKTQNSRRQRLIDGFFVTFFQFFSSYSADCWGSTENLFNAYAVIADTDRM
jgi:hypothetical protein